MTPQTADALRCFWRHPRFCREQIVAFQNDRLRRLITHAYENVPYYRRLFDWNGLKPQDIRAAGDLAAIPMTTKRDLQTLPLAEVLARGADPRRLMLHRTSGSTGQPHDIRRTWFEERLLNMFRWRALSYYGRRPTDRLARITADERVDFVHGLLQRLGLWRMRNVDCLQAPQEIVRQLCAWRPRIIGSLAGAATLVASFMDESSRRRIPLRFMTVGGELVTPAMRRQIGAGFGATVYETYGSSEFNLLAWECKQTGELHVCDDGVVVEILKDGRPVAPGGCGEAVVTSLHAYAMPFIRFRLGDVVTKGADTCGCGQPFSTIRSVQGRMIDYFPLPDGRFLHPYELVDRMLVVAPWVSEYQLVQERTNRIVLHLVPLAPPTPQELATVHTTLAARLTSDVQFEIKLTDKICRGSSGKFRVSCSRVSSHYEKSGS